VNWKAKKLKGGVFFFCLSKKNETGPSFIWCILGTKIFLHRPDLCTKNAFKENGVYFECEIKKPHLLQ